MIRISVIIPTRNRASALAACLTALAECFRPDAETIVVDDGGDQDLAATVTPFIKPLRLRLLRVEHGGPAAARNHGLRAALGKIAVFTDDDCRPQAGWLSAIADGVVLNPPLAVGGATHNGLPANVYADTAQLILYSLSIHDRARVGRERLLPSNNFAFPKDALLRLGGFDERFRTAEDRELCRRWTAAGHALARVPAVVEHDEQLDLQSFVRKFYAYGRGAQSFHESGAGSSLWESAQFHLHLPALAAPELRRRSLLRAVAIVGLLILWEAANLTGFLAQRRSRARQRKADARAGVPARMAR
jgi:glycosyltransferase involved in cell wall biosynthesis